MDYQSCEKHRFIEDLGLFEIKLGGYIPETRVMLEETGTQPYTDARFSAGLVEGHAHDTIYLKLERENEEPLTLLLRRDEALAVIWLLGGALWSESIQPESWGSALPGSLEHPQCQGYLEEAG